MYDVFETIHSINRITCIASSGLIEISRSTFYWACDVIAQLARHFVNLTKWTTKSIRGRDGDGDRLLPHPHLLRLKQVFAVLRLHMFLIFSCKLSNLGNFKCIKHQVFKHVIQYDIQLRRNCKLEVIWDWRIPLNPFFYISDAIMSEGRPLRYPYTWGAQVMQFPYKFHMKNAWVFKWVKHLTIVKKGIWSNVLRFHSGRGS